MGGILRSGGQMYSGSPVAVGNSGGVNWAGIGNQVSAAQTTPYAEFLAKQTAGMQPSIAQAQLKQATDQNIAAQMAMAAGARGANIGTASRMAQQNAAQAGQAEAQQSGMLAAQEAQANASNALQYQGMNNQYAESLYNLANNRDLGIAGVGVKNNEVQMQGTKDFTDFLGNLGGGAAAGAKMLA